MNSLVKIFGLLFLSSLVLRSDAASIGKLNAYKFVDVYSSIPKDGKPGKTNIYWANNKRGVYIIKENGRIVYVGKSHSNIYKTAMRHFQQWNDPFQDRITYAEKINSNRYTIRIIEANKSRIDLIESGLIEKYNPRDNKDKQLSFQDEYSEKIMDQLDQVEELIFEDPPF